MLGYLRETTKLANQAGVDKEFGLVRSGLEEYLKLIYPDIDDWVHDKTFSKEIKTRPDYRSETLKLVVEFDGLPHYMNPDVIRKDVRNTELYEAAGYRVIRIPLFIQLTPAVILRLFNRIVSQEQAFPEDRAISFSVTSRFTPAYIPAAGLSRMAREFIEIAPEQLELNLEYLKSLNDELISGYEVFRTYIEKIK